MAQKGLIMVYTGNGKGKTTAALGLALRMLGYHLPVCMIQFIKGSWKYGELISAERFADLLEWHVTGKGFTWESKDLRVDREAARGGWELAKSRIMAGCHPLIILDELTIAMNFGMITEAEVLETLHHKPAAVHVLITGRDAPAGLLAVADLVTEMRAVRHPFDAGVEAQQGIEY